ncbi:LOW QUALITY PROTEIN: putative transcriptional regulator with HTH domain [Desulfobacter postgatei 2ac9]|uniref:Putative transcriptional regulator with HTH domain n=1 Tax=Desulfobacter postgatei 2ac9 TaxID=879212 RepID=I5B285_9BACT|nr:LOW QUALITY PROTEIN: putative transcriptional regulator with HTH domain [Desulfobacter postgatei 2ac9]
MDHKIKALINQGENQFIEFKEQKVHPDSIAKEMAAFANTQGGTILIGVSDQTEICGVDDSRNWEEWVANISRHNIIPAIQADCIIVEIEGKKIVAVDIPKGNDKPYQTNKNLYHIRIGSTSRIASQAELMRMFQHAGMFHYDLTGIENTSLKHLNMTAISSYFQRYDIDIDDEKDVTSLLINTDILTEKTNVTVAGLLLFGTYPQKFLKNSSISYAHFAGTGLNDELIDRQVIEGNLPFQIDTALSVLKHNIMEASKIEKAKRVIQSTRYPDKVFRELLVNACVHRNYAIHGSRIRILHFDDRIEFISPGRLPNTVTIEKLKSGVSYAVNPVIVKFMENLRYIDKLDRGIPMVCHEARLLGFEPVFQEAGEEFQAILPL